MRKKYLKLTQEQKSRGVVFSSQLKPGDTIHEIFADDPERDRRIGLLLDDKFFNNSPFKVNEIRHL